jgi:hypothetical protein
MDVEVTLNGAMRRRITGDSNGHIPQDTSDWRDDNPSLTNPAGLRGDTSTSIKEEGG